MKYALDLEDCKVINYNKKIYRIIAVKEFGSCPYRR